MFTALIKNIASSVVRNLAVAAFGLLSAHGWATAADEQGVIGSVFFLCMLAVNAFVHNQAVNTAPPDTVAISNATGAVVSIGAVTSTPTKGN